ncbi:hypothetical protein QBC39DRAFT_19484 [Podospora conica]|nr:hypothetical protein QBC39DRAFT_19484 [Schizothecium conicum]
MGSNKRYVPFRELLFRWLIIAMSRRGPKTYAGSSGRTIWLHCAGHQSTTSGWLLTQLSCVGEAVSRSSFHLALGVGVEEWLTVEKASKSFQCWLGCTRGDRLGATKTCDLVWSVAFFATSLLADVLASAASLLASAASLLASAISCSMSSSVTSFLESALATLSIFAATALVMSAINSALRSSVMVGISAMKISAALAIIFIRSPSVELMTRLSATFSKAPSSLVSSAALTFAISTSSATFLPESAIFFWTSSLVSLPSLTVAILLALALTSFSPLTPSPPAILLPLSPDIFDKISAAGTVAAGAARAEGFSLKVKWEWREVVAGKSQGAVWGRRVWEGKSREERKPEKIKRGRRNVGPTKKRGISN